MTNVPHLPLSPQWLGSDTRPEHQEPVCHTAQKKREKEGRKERSKEGRKEARKVGGKDRGREGRKEGSKKKERKKAIKIKN